MPELMEQNDGMNSNLLMDGLSDAVRNYEAAISEVDPDCLKRPDGPTDEERSALVTLNPDIFVPDALELTEDVERIKSTAAFLKAEDEGYIETQYVFDVGVGQAVARNLFGVTNTVEAREMLPDKTIAIFEVNANRGFSRGNEDSAGCHGLPLDWLGHVTVDAFFQGEAALRGYNNYNGQRMDYLGEPGSWTTFGHGLERNAARIRIRPSFPYYTYKTDAEIPRDIFEARLDPAARREREPRGLLPEYAVLRGEYRICRVMSLLHDPTDWKPEDFDTWEDIYKRSNDW